MTSLTDRFADIESDRFWAAVNVANNLKTFLRALELEPSVRDLLAVMDDPAARTAVYERVLALAVEPGDPGYEHRADAALAAYVWVLSQRDEKLATAAATAVGRCRGCWWSRKVAERVLDAGNAFPDSDNGRGVVSGGTIPEAGSGSHVPR